MALQPFEPWLAGKSWTQGVRYSKAVACLLPPAALTLDIPHLTGQAAFSQEFAALLAWQLTAEAFFLGVIAADRWHRPAKGREAMLNVVAACAMVLATWIGVIASWRSGDLSIYVTGITFVATVLCTPRPVRKPMYVLSLLPLAWPAWHRAADGIGTLVLMVNPFCVVFLCIVLDRFSYSRNRELYAETQRADNERARADKVLYNVLPASVADELKQDEKVDARKFENLGVLFADLAGFTYYSRSLPPDALVLMLNQIFSAFDELVDRHGLEKIKTIGDAYMVASHQRIDALCDLALDMQQAIGRYNEANGTNLALRIGINAGPAVAGVIGVKRFLYDVWGDTVNVASRMEETGQAGAVQVTEAVYSQVKRLFTFAPRGPMEVRGRGTMATWWLTARAADQAG